MTHTLTSHMIRQLMDGATSVTITASRTATESLALGDAVTFEDTTGVWIVIGTEAALVARNPLLAGRFRAQRVFDGSGPTHLSAAFPTGEAQLVTGALVDTHLDDEEPATTGYRLTAGRGAIVIVPRPQRAHGSDTDVLETIHALQHSAGLTSDATLVERIPTGWQPAAR